MGGTRSVTAHYLPELDNIYDIYGKKFRKYRNRSNWMLQKDLFEEMNNQLGPCNSDRRPAECASGSVRQLEARREGI